MEQEKKEKIVIKNLRELDRFISIRRTNVENLDPEEGAWRRRRAERRGEIW